MSTFDMFGLPEALRQSLAQLQFTTPTPIQMQSIPAALEGRDILGSAQTGTGKTAAFGIPLLVKLMSNSRGSALVMTPTRELATQVLEQLQSLMGKHTSLDSALLIGGEPMPKQLQQLRSRPRLLVGTPGRINDHLERGSLMLHDTSFLVLDETDRMLDMGFTPQIEKILKFLPKKRQTLLFSATLPKDIVRIAETYLSDPVRVSVAATSSAADNIAHEMVRVSEGDKYARLLAELSAREGSVILFVKTKYGTEKMASRLSKEGFSADAIHGDLRQNKRDKVIANFRSQKYRVLVATDVAARGLDIPHIAHVINYDLPQCAEDYIHRIGRTARAGAQGSAMCLVTPADHGKWAAIDRLLNPGQKPEQDTARYAPKPGKPKRRRFGGKPHGGKPFGGSDNTQSADGGTRNGNTRSFGGDKPSGGAKKNPNGKRFGARPDAGRPAKDGGPRKPGSGKPFRFKKRGGGGNASHTSSGARAA